MNKHAWMRYRGRAFRVDRHRAWLNAIDVAGSLVLAAIAMLTLVFVIVVAEWK